MRLVVNVHPLDAGVAGRGNRTQYERTADSLSLLLRMYRRIEEKRMRTAVPCDIHKTYELKLREGCEIRQALREYWCKIARFVSCPCML